jgi:hypothetical protein
MTNEEALKVGIVTCWLLSEPSHARANRSTDHLISLAELATTGPDIFSMKSQCHHVGLGSIGAAARRAREMILMVAMVL